MTQVPIDANAEAPAVGIPSPTAPRRGHFLKKWTFDRVSFFAIFLGLPLVIYIVLVVSPFVQAIYYSLTGWTGFDSEFPFVGLDNYVRLFSDDLFVKALLNNVVLLIFVPILTIGIALIFAAMIIVGGPSRGNVRGLRGSNFYRIVSFFPFVIPSIAVGLIWAFVYNPNGGLLNGVIGFFGISPVNWLGSENTAMGCVIFVIVWASIGFYMITFIAAMKGVPSEILEAARIDGASRTRIIFTIMIPMIRDNVQTGVIYIGIAALDSFVFMSALAPTGGPNNSTWILSQQLFQTAFVQGRFGEACALGVVLAALTLAFAGLVFFINWVTGGRKENRIR